MALSTVQSRVRVTAMVLSSAEESSQLPVLRVLHRVGRRRQRRHGRLRQRPSGRQMIEVDPLVRAAGGQNDLLHSFRLVGGRRGRDGHTSDGGRVGVEEKGIRKAHAARVSVHHLARLMWWKGRRDAM